MHSVPQRHAASFDHEFPLVFGPFAFFVNRKLLFCRGEPVRLGARAIDLLQALIREPGQTLSQRELVAQVWPDTVVEDSNLRVHVAVLRRALGESADGYGYISNVPGRGYRFTSDVKRAPLSAPRPAGLAHETPLAMPRLQRLAECARLSTIIGRRRETAELAGQLRLHRLLNLVGPGGVGKSTLALAAASEAQQHFAGGVFRIDLGQLPESAGMAGLIDAIADTLRTEAAAARGVLLIFDNCEHVIDAAATLAEQLLLSLPGLTLLVTSREPLAIDGESLWRVDGLAAPPRGHQCDASAQTYPALRLFIERARQTRPFPALDGDELRRVASICRRLDGLPLAIEMAAASICTLGLKGVADQLFRDPLRPGTARRNGPVRHASLHACYGWSYSLLPELEQRLFQRLAGFAGSFSLTAAGTLSDELASTRQEITAALMALVAKSLVIADFRAVETDYYLLRTARAYAGEQQAADTLDLAARPLRRPAALAVVKWSTGRAG